MKSQEFKKLIREEIVKVLREDETDTPAPVPVGKKLKQSLIDLGVPEDSIFAVYNNKIPSLLNPNRRRFKVSITRTKLDKVLAKKIGDMLLTNFNALKDTIFISPSEIYFSTN